MKRRGGFCVYCAGRAQVGRRTCGSHADLERLDPFYPPTSAPAKPAIAAAAAQRPRRAR